MSNRIRWFFGLYPTVGVILGIYYNTIAHSVLYWSVAFWTGVTFILIGISLFNLKVVIGEKAP